MILKTFIANAIRLLIKYSQLDFFYTNSLESKKMIINNQI